MSYELPRKAKTLVPLTAKVIGKNMTKDYKAGKACEVQRSPMNPGEFIIYFQNTKTAAILCKVDAINLVETIEYTDGREQL